MCSLEVKNVLFRTFSQQCTLTTYIIQELLYVACTRCTYHNNNAFRSMRNQRTYCSFSDMFTMNIVPNCPVVRILTFRLMTRLKLVCSGLVGDIKGVSPMRRHWVNILYLHFGDG